MSNKVSENYLDYLLESMNGEAKPREESETTEEPETNKEDKYNIDFEDEVPELKLTSDDEFLQSFERELESDAYRNYFADFEAELEEEERNHSMYSMSGDMPEDIDELLKDMEQPSRKDDMDGDKDDFENSLHLLDDDMKVLSGEDVLAGMKANASRTGTADRRRSKTSERVKTDDGSKIQKDASVEQQDELAGDLSLMGMEEIGEKNPQEAAPAGPLKMTEAGEPDLAGVSDEDLIQMLARAEGLTDIGEILSDNDAGRPAGNDEIAAFASQEMQKQEQDVKEEKSNSGKKAKQGRPSVFGKLKTLLFGKDEEETEAVDSKDSVSQEVIPEMEPLGPIAELTEENQQILMELGEEEIGTDNKKEEKSRSVKASAKKTKNKKTVKAKAQKSSAAKKPKKPKEPQVQEHTPPLPKVPVILCFVLAASFVALVLFGTATAGYSLQLSEARMAFDNQDYSEAYQKIEGMSVKKKDMPMYRKICVLARVDSEYQSYLRFNGYGNQEAALDSLVCAAGRVAINYENAEEAECLPEMDALAGMIGEALSGQYGMTMEEAQTIYDQESRYEYSILIHKKLIELGLE